MAAIRWASAMLAILCWTVTFVTCNIDAVTILGTILVAVWFWTHGVFTWAFWFGDAATNAQLAATDDEIAFTEAVAADIRSLP